MINMISIKELANKLSGKLINPIDKEISCLEYDSRSVKKDSCFFAFLGTHSNGYDFIDQAISNGAIMVVTNKLPKKINNNVSYLLSDENTRKLYAKASSFFFSQPQEKLKIIGITGTDGKTSTTDYTYQLLNSLGFKTGLISTVYIDDGSGKTHSETRQSTPEAFYIHSFLDRCVKNNVEYVVMECTSHALSEEYARVEGINFISSIYTTVSSEHLEFHKTLERYYDAKANLARNTYSNIFIYSDCPLLDKIKSIARHRVIELTKPEITNRTISSTTFFLDGNYYTIPLFGEYNIYNLYEAIMLTSRVTKTPIELILTKCSTIKPVEGRFNVYNINNHIVIIDFAHTPDSYEKLFSAFRFVDKTSPITAVFGSAGDRDKSKRKGLGEVASKYANTIILTEEDPRSENVIDISLDILEGVDKNKSHIYTEEKREDAIRLALKIAKPNSVIFLLGKGHERSISYNGYIRPYLEEKALLEISKELS